MPSPSIVRISSAVPAIQISAAGFLSVATAGSGSGNAPNAESLIAGVSPWTTPLRRNATRQDLGARYGTGGAFSIAYGLGISWTTGLSVTIAAGHALIDGLCESPTALTQPLADNTNSFLWLVRGSPNVAPTVTIETSAGTVPGTPAVYLGEVTTVAGSVTVIDIAGVLYSVGGELTRTTADTGMPVDTPPSASRFLTQTAFNTYFWNGTAHLPLGKPIVTADPATPQNGDVWFRSDTLHDCIRVGGATHYVLYT